MRISVNRIFFYQDVARSEHERDIEGHDKTGNIKLRTFQIGRKIGKYISLLFCIVNLECFPSKLCNSV